MWYMPSFQKMKTDKFGQIIFDEQDIIDLVMQGQDVSALKDLLVDHTVDIKTAPQILENVPAFVCYDELSQAHSVEEFDRRRQSIWYMPDQYRELDIAAHVLSLCNADSELQRCGQELLLYQEKNLFDLLRYLKYLVDIMTENKLIWGVGRGSSTASYVLYKLGVHRIDSLHYDLDVNEFLR